MVEAKILDRIEQSFELFKKCFVYLVAPLLSYYLFSFFMGGILIIYLLFSWIIWANIFDTMDYNNIFLFLSNPKIILLILISMIFWLLYILIYIPFLIYSIKTIGDFHKWVDKINFKENFMYSLNRFIPIMKTYRYIFAYVALIPALIFIIWWLIFNLGYFLNWNDIYKIVWGTFMVSWGVLFMIFAIYRWLKTSFSIYSAVDNDDYSRENFNFSVKITSKKWWRIFWNMILIWMIIWLLSWIASNFFSIFFSNSWVLSLISNDFTNKDALKSFISNFSFFNYFVSWFFDILIKTIGNVFLFIFLYLFYKRLSFEYLNSEDTIVIEKEKNIEL